MKRECGGCTLCCKLLPVHSRWGEPEFHKPANTPCQHQRHGKGCAIYAARPYSCRVFSCRWLLNDDTADLPRPDRSRYVIDPSPDFVVLEDKNSGERRNIEVVQVWCDPKYPNAWQDDRLCAYMARRAAEGILTLVRFDSHDALTVFPPAMSPSGEWGYLRGNCNAQHGADDVIDAIGDATTARLLLPLLARAR